MGGFDYKANGTLPVGAQIPCSDVPDDGKWLLCSGDSVSISTYPEYASIRKLKGLSEGTVISTGANMLGVAYLNNTYVGLYPGATAFGYSSDGITWSVGTLPSSAGSGTSSNRVAHNGSAWVLLLGGNTSTMRIARGTSLASVTAMTSSDNSFATDSVAWNGTVFCVTSSGGTTTKLETSADGITWSSQTVTSYTTGRIAALGNLFIMVDGIGGSTNYYTSTNGTTWTTRSLPGAAWSSPSILICGTSAIIYDASGRAARSTDGVNWTQYMMKPHFGSSISTITSGSAGINMVVGGPIQNVGASAIYTSFVSTDYGVTWEQVCNIASTAQPYPSSDGERIVVWASAATSVVATYAPDRSKVKLPYRPGYAVRVRR